MRTSPICSDLSLPPTRSDPEPDPEPAPTQTTGLNPTRSRRRRRPPKRCSPKSRSLYDQRQEALTSSPPDEIRAAELLARIGELLATVEELDVEPEPAQEPTDSDEVDA